MRIVADATRTLWYYSELDKHPIFQWAKVNKLYLPELELAQHYGIPTALLDLSESIEVALFFATHEFKNGMFHPCTSGLGILYVVDRTRLPKGLVSRFTSVASQPFLRPLRQWAWTCELLMGECFEDCPSLGAIQFEHSESLANKVRVMAEADGNLFPTDPLADIAANINASKVLPQKYVKAAREFYGEALPGDRFGCIEDALSRAGHDIESGVPEVFSNASLAAIGVAYEAAIAAWRASTSARMEQLYVRGGRATGRPLEYGVLKPPSVEGEEWKIVPVPHYGSLFDE